MTSFVNDPLLKLNPRELDQRAGSRGLDIHIVDQEQLKLNPGHVTYFERITVTLCLISLTAMDDDLSLYTRLSRD